MMKLLSAVGVALLALPGGQAAPSEGLPLRVETRRSLNSRLSNVHIEHREHVQGPISYTYGSCESSNHQEAHHSIGQSTSSSHDRLVWVIPEDVYSGGCISAWRDSTGRLLGRSEKQHFDFQTMEKRRTLKRSTPGSNSIAMTAANGIDAWGPWFDGVKLLKDTEIKPVDAAAAKKKNIAIVGAGMSGLMTYLCLTQAGMKNVHIIEAGDRLGGRVHTVYLTGGPFDYSYQEMGPMRFPSTITLGNETYNVSDHQMVFQLAEELNSLNKVKKSSKHTKGDLSVDFIPWLQSSPNGLYYQNGIRLANGMPPTQAMVAQNSSLKITNVPDKSALELSEKVEEALPGEEFMVEMAQNMFKAHREWLDSGLGGLPGDHWSEFAYMVNYLNASLNDTNFLGGGAASFWDDLYEGMYFSATTWKTIDGGLNRLPQAFGPLVDKATTFNRHIERIQFDSASSKVTLQSRGSYKDKLVNSTHDYAVLAVPFSVMKKWRIRPNLPQTVGSAIANVPYTSACKVALEFRSRFWEHFANPIYGSCSTVSDIPGIGSICYPSYNINGSGPATILGSYISGMDFGERWVSTPEQEHVQYVLDAMIEIHGDVARREYTGKYNRRCWALDPLESASWASPTIGQHQLFLPEYFKTHNNMIFVGEHTSYTHAWIASALESGIRGSVQLLLELGLVDEAKATVDKWMARWIDV
ncbi:flavin-containing amine oxidoreductase-domain containing protein [Apodospora peruviana]|uniref:Flavin-containing amine oxidoreductase-domain containing protein n=1 Tax=Apodospora peruviana TaxID=516989 RepID=A0AAE0MB46_9PEZI|nr:flavin-containing amine oxidoreductase-domain containing protein [Apodospora peruviana]